MAQATEAAIGARAVALLRELAAISEPGPGVTRLFLTPEHRRAIDLLERRMREAGMATHLDAAGTLVGRYEGTEPGAPALLLGSHIDSVRQGGAYDGALGVVLPLVCVAALHEAGTRLPIALEVVAFGDEEGVRFPSTLLGSRALAGQIDPAALDGRDASGTSLRDALVAFGLDPAALEQAARRPESVVGYVEVHIEQGPVLERENLPVGIVTAIAAASRHRVAITGMAGHAGTVPMAGRQDALCAAADCVLAVERSARGRPGAVGTVGTIEALPGAANVIPGEVRFSLDLRAPEDEALAEFVREASASISLLCGRRGVAVQIEDVHAARACAMSPELSDRLAEAARAVGLPVRYLPSGAGHDAMVMASLAPTAMLFVRCRGGVSHRPDEHASAEDVAAAGAVLLAFLRGFAGAAAA